MRLLEWFRALREAQTPAMAETARNALFAIGCAAGVLLAINQYITMFYE